MDREDIITVLKKYSKLRKKELKSTKSSKYSDILKELQELCLLPSKIKSTSSYFIEEVDEKNAKIILFDKNSNTYYQTMLTFDITSLDKRNPNNIFVKVTTKAPEYQEEFVYDLSGNLLTTKISKKFGMREIEIEKVETAAHKYVTGTTPTISLKYYKDISDTKKLLYEKKVAKPSNCSHPLQITRRLFRNPKKTSSKVDLSDYYYYSNKNMIHIIGSMEERGKSYLKAVLYKRVPQDLEDFFPAAMSTRLYPELSDDETISALIFRGITQENHHHYLNIFKKKDGIHISYEEETPDSTKKKKDQKPDEAFLKGLTKKEISTKEIGCLVEYLTLNYNNEFMAQVVEILKATGEKIQDPNDYNSQAIALKDVPLVPDSYSTLKEKVISEPERYINCITEEYTAITGKKQLTYQKRN